MRLTPVHHITYPMAMARHDEYMRLSHPIVEMEFQSCVFSEGIETRTNGSVPMAIVRAVSLNGLYFFSNGLDRTVYADQQIVHASIRRSPIKLCSVIVRVSSAPPTIRVTPMNESMTLCQIFLSIFSMPRIELRRAMNMGVVANIREELPAVVRAMPLMNRSWWAVFPISASRMKRLTSFLLTLRFRSRIHRIVSRNSEAMLKRIALKLEGEKFVKAILTIEKFMPQTKLIHMSIKSTAENLVSEGPCELLAVMYPPLNYTCSGDMNR